MSKSSIPKFWHTSKKKKIDCKEKIKVLNANVIQLEELVLDVYDEAVLLGVDKNQIRAVILKILEEIGSDLKKG
tara:strand:- start:73 stop:294 length:222 start_codon:yes stop_codon:yes gene_type:complete